MISHSISYLNQGPSIIRLPELMDFDPNMEQAYVIEMENIYK